MANGKNFIIEHGTCNNRWLVRIENEGGEKGGEQTCTYAADGKAALRFNKAQAVAFATKWKARVWQLKGGAPEKQVFPA
ncbi:MAG: hypothetical protein IKN04_20445 [Clostridia bacterium]|nr:hypothetical protein [Clostridia bacterium]